MNNKTNSRLDILPYNQNSIDLEKNDLKDGNSIISQKKRGIRVIRSTPPLKRTSGRECMFIVEILKIWYRKLFKSIIVYQPSNFDLEKHSLLW
ncbi:MAG: hypothetical protein M3Z01_00245 [Thermoproteota archaeon]|nr:hypothetical protein [Thermoproteota archaeon]